MNCCKHLLLLWMICCVHIYSFGQTVKIDSLKHILKTAKEDTARVNILNQMGQELFHVNEYEKAITCFRKADTLAEKLGYTKGIGLSLINIGIIYENKSDYPSAIPYHNQALKLFRQAGDKLNEGKALRALGNNYFDQYDIPNSLENYINAAKAFEETGAKKELCGTLRNLGLVHFNLDNFEQSYKYYSEAKKISEVNGDRNGYALALWGLGMSSHRLNEHVKGDNFLLQALEIQEVTHDSANMVETYRWLGLFKKDQLNYSAASNYLFKSLEIATRLKNKRKIMGISESLGQLFKDKNPPEFGKSLEYLNMELEIAKEIGNKNFIAGAYSNICGNYQKQKKFEEAFYFQLKCDSLLADVFTLEKNKLILEMESKYQNEKKEKEISILQKENEIKQLTINKSETRIIFLSAGIVLVLLLGFLFYQWKQLKQKQKFNAEMLHQQELRLKAIIETQEEERNRIAKDLHDGVGQLLSGLKIAWQNLTSTIESRIPELHEPLVSSNKILDDTATEVRSIAHQMMPQALGKAGLVAALEDMLSKTFNNTTLHYKFVHSNCSGHFEKNVEINLYRITQELVNNIFKHSGANEVSVVLLKDETHLTLMVEDNGKGFNAEEHKEKGMGLMNIITRAKSINGEVSFEKGNNGGMITTIRVAQA